MVRRRLIKKLRDALSDNPVAMIVGPRQAGKSTLVEELTDREYITLDDPVILEQITTNAGDVLDSFPGAVTIDEVQRAPKILLPIKLRVDRNRTAGRYLLTGSANVLTLPKVSESLAGRMEVLDLLPLTQAEIEGHDGNFIDRIFSDDPIQAGTWPEEDDLIERVVRGGFPQPALARRADRRRDWADSYIRTLLDRDVRDLANIEGARQFPQIFRLLAARNGGTLNVDSLSRDTGIPSTTVRRYIDLMAKMFLLQQVPAWSGNMSTRFVKAPKVYLCDSLLTSHLLHIEASHLKQDRLRLGPILEGFVANELARLQTYSDVRPWLHHLRTVRQKEVDFVLELGDRKIVGIEVKSSRSLSPSDSHGLEYLQSLDPDRFHRGVILYDGHRTVRINKHIIGLPMAALWNVAPMG